jgi:hypothetical protein
MSKHSRASTLSTAPRLLSRTDAATFLSVSPRLLTKLVQRGDIIPIRFPGIRRVAFDIKDLTHVVDRWKSCRTAPDIETPSAPPVATGR